MRVPIKPFTVYVPKGVTQNAVAPGDTVDGFLKSEVIALTSYPGQVLTADIMIEGNYIFSNIPFHLMYPKRESGLTTTIRDLSDSYHHHYRNNPDKDIDVSYLPLYGVHVHVKDDVVPGIYICTVDWYNDNELVHVVQCPDRFILAPNHKMSIGNVRLPKYQKLRTSWVL